VNKHELFFKRQSQAHSGLLDNCVCVFFFQPEEKSKFDGIFESLAPVNGLLSGEKVKPVLINSKLPLDVLGKVLISAVSYIIIMIITLFIEYL